MAEVVPFRGVIYNMSKVSGEDVVAPPYDIITPAYKEQLYSKSPYNIVRIDFGKELEGDSDSENRYKRAAAYLNSWLKEEVLERGESRCFYVYEITYKFKGHVKKLRGFFGLVRLKELGDGVYPHECTHSKPKTDRLNLMRACNANISPIFSLYNSPEKKASGIIEDVINKRKPYIEAKDSNDAVHRLWIIEDKKAIDTIMADLKGRAVFIADGHHRYETALEFRMEMNALLGKSHVATERRTLNAEPNPWDYVLMFLANMSDEGITILPAHRLVRNMPEKAYDILSEYFEIEAVQGSDNIEQVIADRAPAIGFCQCDGSRQYVLRHKGKGLDDIHPALRGLDVSVLHELIFKKLLNITDVAYEMDAKETINMVAKGMYDAAFFLNPTRVADVERVALSSVRMPPKSTYFFPKLLTGMVIYKFSG